MIWLFNSRNKPTGSYQNFEEVCDHFRRVEHLKPLPAAGPGPGGRWDFIYWPHKRLVSLHEHLKDTPFRPAEQEAFERELDLIEIFDSRPQASVQYMVTSDLDISSLMREWCFGYAHHHQYTILETHSSRLFGGFASAAIAFG